MKNTGKQSCGLPEGLREAPVDHKRAVCMYSADRMWDHIYYAAHSLGLTGAHKAGSTEGLIAQSKQDSKTYHFPPNNQCIWFFSLSSLHTHTIESL